MALKLRGTVPGLARFSMDGLLFQSLKYLLHRVSGKLISPHLTYATLSDIDLRGFSASLVCCSYDRLAHQYVLTFPYRIRRYMVCCNE